MSVIVCVLLAWTSHCGVFPAQVTTKWEGRKSKKKFGKGGRGKRCAYWFYGLSMLKKKKKPRKLKTLTHTHTHSQISLFWSRAVHGLSGFSRNWNRDKRKYSLLAFSHFPIMYLLTWLPHEVEWEARATCFAKSALVCCPGQVQVQSWGVSRRARVMRVTNGLEGEG